METFGYQPTTSSDDTMLVEEFIQDATKGLPLPQDILNCVSEGKRPIEAYHSWASELVRRFGALFNEEIFRLSEPSIKSPEVKRILLRIFSTISVFAQGETDLEVALE